MNDDTDFLKFYRQLGVEPGCTLQAFKQAYRRRVAQLHPDRSDGGRDDSEGLKELNLQYALSRAFHRLHGRLPGTPPAPPVSTSTVPPTRERLVETGRGRPPTLPHHPPNRWLLLVFSLVAVLPLWTLLPSPDKGDKETQHPVNPSGGLSTFAPTTLQVGMETATVAALLGEPIVNPDDEEHWVYGPSWIRFECGQVVDWYSSVLHPLPIADPGPAVPVDGKQPAGPPDRCLANPRRESMVMPASATFARLSGIV